MYAYNYLKILPMLIKVAITIVQVAFCASLIGLLVGGILAALSSKVWNIKSVAQVIDLYILFVHGVPIYIFVLIFYYCVPKILGLHISPFLMGTGALGCYSITFFYPTIKKTINICIDDQTVFWNSSSRLGVFVKSILPNVLKSNVNSFLDQFSVLIKKTYVLSTIGIIHITKVVSTANHNIVHPLKAYLIVACIYLSLSMVLEIVIKKTRKRLIK